MFAKGYTNIRAMIETQYGILSHMITDIAYRYQTLLKQTEEEADRLAQNNSDGDYDVYHTILNSFNDVEERSLCLMTESRKILFCAIFSYYETMLNEFVLYYKIANNATQPSQILDSILKAYKTKYGEEITCIEEETKQQALKRYCKYEHLLHLLKECLIIRPLYKQEIEKIYNIAFKYMKYNKSCLQKDIQILGR